DDSVTVRSTGERPAVYTQAFRDGSVEAVDMRLLRQSPNHTDIQITSVERECVESIKRYLSFQQRAGIEPPIIIMMSLLSVCGRSIPSTQYPGGYLPRAVLYGKKFPFDRDHLILPDVIYDTHDQPVTEVMRRAFDALWNAGGYPRSMNYD
ncbi:MAG: hypothetical protein M3275_12220, partial [Thermoproteota archaeon]|nr:hypothetical protein [Thermoproteota archaeon]